MKDYFATSINGNQDEAKPVSLRQLMQHMFKHAPDYRYDEADFRLIADGSTRMGAALLERSSSI